MKTIYLVRHGESEANIGLHYQGKHTALTERGREQARFIAERAAKLPLDCLIASTAVRALDTAATIGERIGKPIETSELFLERRRPKVLIGRALDDARAVEIDKAWTSTLYAEGERYEDGENFEDLKVRAGKALAYLEGRPESNIMVVTHGFFARALLSHVLFGKDYTVAEFSKIVHGVRQDNTGISVLRFDDEVKPRVDKIPSRGWYMIVWNDHAHLG